MIILTVWNIIVFLLYGIDKFKSKINAWRISEKVLLLSAAVLGGIGALLGIYVFRHKTRKWYFVGVASVSAILTLLVYFIIFYLKSRLGASLLF